VNRLVSILTCCLALAGTGVVCGMDVAIVVNKDNPINELSFRELTAIFELQQQFWKGGDKVRVIIQKAGRPEKNVMLKSVYHRTDESLNKYWLIRMFKAEIADLPEVEASNERVKQEVSKQVDAISFIDASKVDDTVKVLKIDGLLPGAEKYRVKSEDERP
jgi:ABC-type phosphate transport system substrate-binding protein